MEPSDDQKLADEWAAALGEDPSAPSVDVDEVLAAPCLLYTSDAADD